MTIHCKDQKSLMFFLMWTDPFQPKSDWWTSTHGGIDLDSCIVTDGIGG